MLPSEMSITATEVDQVAAGVSPPNNHLLASAFRAQATSDDPLEPWRLLANIFDIYLRPSNPEEPFGPMLVVEGKRSMVPSEFHRRPGALLAAIA